MAKETSTHDSSFLKIIIIIFVVLLSCFFFINYFYQKYSRGSKANLAVAFQSTNGTLSSANVDKTSSSFNLYTPGEPLFVANGQGLTAAYEFLQSNPQLQGGSAVSETSISRSLLPSGIASSVRLTRSMDDTKQASLNLQNKGQHYYYNQLVGGNAVYGGTVAVHVKNGNEVYATNGNLLTSPAVPASVISREEAQQKALVEAQKETTVTLSVKTVKRFVFNYKLLGISEDNKNYLTDSVEVVNTGKYVSFDRQYFVDLETGAILYSQNLMHAQTVAGPKRFVFDCGGNEATCPLKRNDPPPADPGSAVTNDTDIDQGFDSLGLAYNLYKTQYVPGIDRDSYDNAGGDLDLLAKIPQAAANDPNHDYCGRAAAWITAQKQIQACPGFVTRDVIGHELTHGVIQFSPANLEYTYQAGALNESIADIMGSAVDGNWTIGEETPLHVIRDMSDPPAKNQPDSLFSDKYYCGNADNYGVHTNSGVFNKAFYLMTDGGNFNGCSIAGVGRSKAHPVVYRALTYLTQFSNFRDAYEAMQQACADLYGADSTDCQNIKKAMEATEMDQQMEGNQNGSACSGVTKQPATCVAQSTSTPTVLPNSTSTPTPTVPPNSTPTPTPTITPTVPPGSTATPTPTQEPTETPTPPPTQTKTVCPTGTAGQGGCDYIGANGLQQAVDQIADGGKVLIKEGTYSNVVLKIGTGAEHIIKKNILIAGENNKVKLIGADKQKDVISVAQDSSVRVEKLDISKGRNGILVSNNANTQIRGLVVHNTDNHGVTADNQASMLVANSILANNKKSGIFYFGTSGGAVRNNIAFQNGYQGFDCGGDARCVIVNNIAYKNAKVGIIAAKKENFERLDYNDSFENGAGNYNTTFGAWPPATNKSFNPLFTGANNFHLKKTSAAIDAGAPGRKDTDFTRSDMGAYGGPNTCLLDDTMTGCVNGPSPKPTSTLAPTKKPTPTKKATLTPTKGPTRTPTPRPTNPPECYSNNDCEASVWDKGCYCDTTGGGGSCLRADSGTYTCRSTLTGGGGSGGGGTLSCTPETKPSCDSATLCGTGKTAYAECISSGTWECKCQ